MTSRYIRPLTLLAIFMSGLHASQAGALIQNPAARIDFDLQTGLYNLAMPPSAPAAVAGAHAAIEGWASSDAVYQRRVVEQSDRRMRIECVGAGVPTLLLEFTLHPAFVELRAGLRNTTAAPLRVKKFEPLAGGVLFPGDECPHNNPSIIQIMKTMKPIATGVMMLSAAVHFPALGAEPPKPYGAVPNLRQLRWHEMEMYAFAHFGPDTFNDVEWGSGAEKATDFNPADLDARQVVTAAKAGGMKGLVLTAKHHDGFCLWPSKFTEHCVRNSTWRNGEGDVVREFADACRQQNLKFGVYLSPWDRNHAEYGRAGYVEYYKNQIRELLTNYGPIFEMWFDGANGGDGYYGGQGGKRKVDYNTYYDWKGIRAIIRELQPDCAIWCGQYRDGDKIVYADCRWGGSEGGDVGDPCWNTMDSAKLTIEIPDCQHGKRNGDAWCGAEGDVSIRPGWFYHANQDAQVKSPERLMAIYQSCVGRGANLILNIPPDKRGRLHDNDVASLKLFGEHLEKTFSSNLAKDAEPHASNVRGEDRVTYGPQKLTDADPWSAWITDDEVTTAEVVLDLGTEQTFNLIRLREDIRLGQRVDEAAVDVWTLGAWKEVAKAQSIGAMRLWKIGETKTDKVRLRVTQAAACPAISDFGLFFEPPVPSWSARDEARAESRRR